MKTIPLTQGQVAIVDDEDFERLSQFSWHAAFYPITQKYVAKRVLATVKQPNGRWKNLGRTMQAEILGVMSGLQIDHKNLDSLDNRKENLRWATRQEQARNRKGRSNNRNGYKGIERIRSGRFRARIGISGRNLHLGCFDTAEEAAKAYDEAARQHFGEFAHSNFPEQQTTTTT
jgi:hypothetical protein